MLQVDSKSHYLVFTIHVSLFLLSVLSHSLLPFPPCHYDASVWDFCPALWERMVFRADCKKVVYEWLKAMRSDREQKQVTLVLIKC